MPGASYHRGASNSTVATPPEFISAVERRFGRLAWDLCADETNHCAPNWIELPPRNLDTLDRAVNEVKGRLLYDSLNLNWSMLGDDPLWLNPPYSNIEPWVRKASMEAAEILALVPASVGTKWWRKWVHYRCQVEFLCPRITFVGHRHNFPKDLALLRYGSDTSYGYWDWKADAQ